MTESFFITGASGFIGRILAERLRSEGAEVRGVDLAADPDRGVVAGDITAPATWQQHVEGTDVLIHTAAIVSNAVDFAQSWSANVLGTRRALDAASAAGIKRFVHFSSIRAFSDLHYPAGVDERYPVRPDGNAYVDTKVASEQVVLQAHAAGEVAATIVRPGDVYGPGSRPWTLLPLEAIKARQMILPAMGKGIFSPVYVDNLVDGVLLAARRQEGAGQVFTISDGIGVTCQEFFANYARMLGRDRVPSAPTVVALTLAWGAALVARARGQPTEANPTAVRYFTRRGTYSIEKARRLLGYIPRVSLEEGMRRTEAWLREEGFLPL